MSLNFIKLLFTADTAKEFSPEKKGTEHFHLCIVTSQCFFRNFNVFYQKLQIFTYELMRFKWLATSRHLWFLCATFVQSRAQRKQRQKHWPWNVLSSKGGVSQYTCEACGLELQQKGTFPDPQGNWWTVNKTQLTSYFMFLLFFMLLICIIYESPNRTPPD